MNTGMKVRFNITGINGEILDTKDGKVTKIFKNGKAQVECKVHFSGMYDEIRKTTYNVPINKLELI